MILGDKPKQGENHETIHTINPVPGTHHIDKLITVAGAAVVAAAVILATAYGDIYGGFWGVAAGTVITT